MEFLVKVPGLKQICWPAGTEVQEHNIPFGFSYHTLLSQRPDCCCGEIPVRLHFAEPVADNDLCGKQIIMSALGIVTVFIAITKQR